MPLVIWLNIVTIIDWSVRLLPAYIRKDVHAIRQLHCQWWPGQCHAKQCRIHCFSSQHLFRFNHLLFTKKIFNRNRKLKQQVSKLSASKSSVCSKINACYVFAWFLWTPAPRSLSEVHVIFCQCFFYLFFLWPPYAPALVTEVRESYTRGGPWVWIEKLLLGFFPGHP